jgi:protein-tyrosine phosphatase
LLVAAAVLHGGWYLIVAWPAISFGAVADGYFSVGPVVYGKSTEGTLATPNQLLLLPYLLYLWSVWHGIRLIKREAAIDQLTENIFIGRRLRSHELPQHIDHVIDLTCEFAKSTPPSLKSYHSFQILDAAVPSVENLQDWVRQTVELTGHVYIHCAEGHGRTGLFAAAILLYIGHSQHPSDALRFIQSKRPLVRLSKRQSIALSNFHATLERSI